MAVLGVLVSTFALSRSKSPTANEKVRLTSAPTEERSEPALQLAPSKTALDSEGQPVKGFLDSERSESKFPILAFVTCVITLGLFVANFLLWCVTRDAFRTEAGAQIAVTNIHWAVDPLRGTRVPADQLRCPDVDGTSHVCFLINYTNGGRTPATNIRQVVHVVADSSNARQDIDKWIPPSYTGDSGRTNMSGEKHEWRAWSEERISDDCKGEAGCIATSTAEAMVGERVRWNIYGALQYRDVFGRDHATRFCYIVPRVVCSQAGGCFIPCEYGNWMDKPGDVGNSKPWYERLCSLK